MGGLKDGISFCKIFKKEIFSKVGYTIIYGNIMIKFWGMIGKKKKCMYVHDKLFFKTVLFAFAKVKGFKQCGET